MLRTSVVVGVLCALSACAKAVQIEAAEPIDDRYRPSWTSNLELHVDGARACLEGREEPRFVAHIEPLATAIGFTTVDAYGATQNCVYADGKVVRREPAGVRAVELAGLPLFAVGSAQPALPVGVKLEEVLDQEQVVGWLFWPAVSESAEEQVP